MAMMCIAKIITSRVKRHRVYRYSYKVGEYFVCEIEVSNYHSNNAISVINKKMVVRHVPEELAAKFASCTL